MKKIDARLIATLRASAVHLPATDLASHLAVPLATIEARLAELRGAGFEIEERPGLGFRLVGSPDRLIADDIMARLDSDCALVRDIMVFEETDSTNDLAMQRGRQRESGGLVIFAERQTAGRGRFGRAWASASHRGLWFSLLLRPSVPLAHWPRLTTWAAVSLSDAIEHSLGLATAIKWPNDVQVGGRKVAGILAESGADLAGTPFAVVGIGVNVNHEPDDFPAELASRATSLRMASGRTIDRPTFAAALLRALDARLPQVEADFARIVATVTQRSSLMGKWIRVQSGSEILEGHAEALDAEGCLLLRSVDGALQRLSAGEVTLAPN